MTKPQTSTQQLTSREAKWELPLVLFLMWVVFVSIPICLGRVGLGWDGLNHQIYLGWVADTARFDKDYMAASLQSYQFPYLYWPVYKLAISGFSGVAAGVVLSTVHLITVPPVWIIAKTMIPEKDSLGIGLRLAAVFLAFMSAVPLKTLEATGNDLLAAAPMLWALAIAFKAISYRASYKKTSFILLALLSGLLGGIAVACKLSNGPLVLLLPGLFWFCEGTRIERMKWIAVNSVAVGLGFFAIYGYWGYQLWLQFGNPLFPFYDELFDPIRILLGWQP